MKRYRRRVDASPLMQVDSLMDILTCTVGIMVVVAMFSAIESSDISFRLFRPMVQAAPEKMSRRLVIVSDETARFLESGSVVREFAKFINEKDVDYFSMPQFAEEFNQLGLKDAWFEYSIDVTTDLFSFPSTRYWQLLVSEREGRKGESADDAGHVGSAFLTTLENFDPGKDWIWFLVAPDSIEAFRSLRQIVAQKGFVNGWDALDFQFPVRERLSRRSTQGQVPKPGPQP